MWAKVNCFFMVNPQALKQRPLLLKSIYFFMVHYSSHRFICLYRNLYVLKTKLHLGWAAKMPYLCTLTPASYISDWTGHIVLVRDDRHSARKLWSQYRHSRHALGHLCFPRKWTASLGCRRLQLGFLCCLSGLKGRRRGVISICANEAGYRNCENSQIWYHFIAPITIITCECLQWCSMECVH